MVFHWVQSQLAALKKEQTMQSCSFPICSQWSVHMHTPTICSQVCHIVLYWIQFLIMNMFTRKKSVLLSRNFLYHLNYFATHTFKWRDLLCRATATSLPFTCSHCNTRRFKYYAHLLTEHWFRSEYIINHDFVVVVADLFVYLLYFYDWQLFAR